MCNGSMPYVDTGHSQGAETIIYTVNLMQTLPDWKRPIFYNFDKNLGNFVAAKLVIALNVIFCIWFGFQSDLFIKLELGRVGRWI